MTAFDEDASSNGLRARPADEAATWPPSDDALSVTDPPPARTFPALAAESIPVIVSSGHVDVRSEPVTASTVAVPMAVGGSDGELRMPIASMVPHERARRSGGFSAAEMPTLETLFSPDAGEGVTTELPGRYAKLRSISAGETVTVSVARDLHVGREIALKELSPGGVPGEGVGGGTFASRESCFMQEVRILARLEHPNAVTLHEFGRWPDGTLYCTMRLARGRTLREKLEDRPLSARLELLPSFLALCQAVAHAHSRGIVHRDLAPDAVMIGDFGETVLLGWGRARAQGEPDVHRLVPARKPDARGSAVWGAASCGGVAYMSPERARGEIDHVTEASDVFSLGAILYQLLTGAPPASGSRAAEAEVTIDERLVVVDPLEVEPRCPPELAAVALRALSTHPGRRHPDAQALVADLEECVAIALAGAQRRRAGDRLRRIQPWPGVALLVALVLLAGALVVGLSLAG